MKARMILIVSLLVLLSAFVPVLAEAQTEIAIQGPWIIYKDNQFTDDKGNVIPVLVAIAPTGAIDPKDVGSSAHYKPDGMHHRPPQLSTGDGYYITEQNIYCLAFADGPTDPLKCVPKAPSPTSSKYSPIQIQHNGARWNWWNVVNGLNGHRAQTALILPMPDSITNDGTWPVMFASSFDEKGTNYKYDTTPKHSTGLILHYQNAPQQFGLVMCTPAPGTGHQYFGVGDCTQAATTDTTHTDTHLENSGTLRIQMKAPYNVDGCDIHARMGHRQMASLLSDFVGAHAFIEPAYYKSANVGTVGFEDESNHPCFTRERKKLGTNLPTNHAEEDTQIAHTKAASQAESFLPTQDTLKALVNAFDKFNQDFSTETGINLLSTKSMRRDTDKYDSSDFVLADQSVTEAEAIMNSYNPKFPRISQITRIATLLETANGAIGSFSKHNALQLHLGLLHELVKLLSQLKAYNGPGKSAGDCLATLTEVVDHP